MSTNYQEQGQHKSDNAQQPGRGVKQRAKELASKYPKVVNAGISTGLDILAGLAGAALGAAIGRKSLYWGAGVNFTGHMVNFKPLSTFGTAMAVVNVISGDPIVNGTDQPSKWEQAKARLLAYKDNIIHKLYLDSLFKKQKPTEGSTTQAPTESKPVGEVKHFVYPYDSIIPENTGARVEIQQPVQGVKELDFSALDEIENKLADSAKEYQQKTNDAPTAQSINGYLGELAEDPLY